MEFTLSKIAEKMKCSNCTGYLRLPIIFCTDGNNVCGLCKDKVTTAVGINVCLESIGSTLSFPCRNVTNGCPLKILWEDLEMHEIGCSYSQYTCPNCPTWKGVASTLWTHIRSQHTVETDITLAINKNTELSFFEIGKDKYYVLIKCDFDAGFAWFSMKSLKPLDQTRKKYFIITITAVNTEHVDLQPMEHSFNWDLNKDLTIKLDVHVLQTELKMKSGTILRIGFKVSSKASICIGTFDKSMLLDLECPVCCEYMTAPIYMCVLGHSICNDCKPILEDCPICRAQFSNTLRNYALESISNKLRYKCMYEERGCTFTSLLEQMAQHESTCDYGKPDCPVKDFVK